MTDILSLMSQKDQMATLNDLGKKDYQATVNYKIPPVKLRSTRRQSPRMLCSVYHIRKVAELDS